MSDDRRMLVVAVLLAVLLTSIGLGSATISLTDEARVAGIGREIMDSGDPAVPLLNGEPFLEKPPLYWWVQIGSYRLFGVNDAAARAPSALFGILTLLLAFAMGRRLGGSRCGLLTMLTLATFTGFFDLVHRCLVDPALVFAVALGTFGFLEWIDPASDRERRVGAVLWGVSVPLSWFAKGVAGPAFTVGAPLLHLLFARRFRQLASAWLPAAIALGLTLVTAGPYLLALKASAGADAVKELVFGQTFARVVGAEEGLPSHAKPFWWYLGGAPGRLVPWLLLLPAVLKSNVLRRAEDATGRRAMAGCFFFGLLLLSLATDKRGIYVVPILPALAAPIGYWFSTLGDERPDRDWDRPSLLITLGVLAVVPALLALAMLAVKLGVVSSRRHALDAMANAIPPALVATTVLAGAAATFWLLRGLIRHLRGGDTPGAAWVLAPAAALLLFFQVAIRPVQDAADTGRPLTTKIAELVPEDSGLPLLLVGRESLLGFLYFDHQRHMYVVWGPISLRRALEAGVGRFVVSEEKDLDEKLAPPFRSRFRRLWIEPHRRKDPFGIWEWDGTLPPKK